MSLLSVENYVWHQPRQGKRFKYLIVYNSKRNTKTTRDAHFISPRHFDKMWPSRTLLEMVCSTQSTTFCICEVWPSFVCECPSCVVHTVETDRKQVSGPATKAAVNSKQRSSLHRQRYKEAALLTHKKISPSWFFYDGGKARDDIVERKRLVEKKNIVWLIQKPNANRFWCGS